MLVEQADPSSEPSAVTEVAPAIVAAGAPEEEEAAEAGPDGDATLDATLDARRDAMVETHPLAAELTPVRVSLSAGNVIADGLAIRDGEFARPTCTSPSEPIPGTVFFRSSTEVCTTEGDPVEVEHVVATAERALLVAKGRWVTLVTPRGTKRIRTRPLCAPDCERAAVSDDGRSILIERGRRLELIDGRRGRRTTLTKARPGVAPLTSFQYRRGTFFARRLGLYEVMTGRKLSRTTRQARPRDADGIAFSPHGNWLAFAARDDSSRLVRVRNGADVHVTEDPVDRFLFSEDESRFVMLHGDRYRALTLGRARRLSPDSAGSVPRPTELLPDGSAFLSCVSGHVALTDVTTSARTETSIACQGLPSVSRDGRWALVGNVLSALPSGPVLRFFAGPLPTSEPPTEEAEATDESTADGSGDEERDDESTEGADEAAEPALVPHLVVVDSRDRVALFPERSSVPGRDGAEVTVTSIRSLLGGAVD